MTHRVLLSPAARADLSGTWSYSVERWGIPQAESYIRLIKDACDKLTENPLIGTGCDSIRHGYRRVMVRSHRIFYRVDSDGTINIIRILHSRMEPRKRL